MRTSDRISSMAATYAKLTAQQLLARAGDVRSLERTAAEIRSMAASLLAQDEHKGLRGLVKKVLGK